MLDRKDWIAVLAIALLVVAVSWRAVLGGVFYSGDIWHLQYPLRSAYAAELARSALPLWTPHLLAGYPLLAEGQLGALYPPNVVLYRLLPVAVALDIFVVGHLVWAAVGAYAFARRQGLRRTPACAMALVYGLGAFLLGRVHHINGTGCAAWLPWLLLLADRLVAGIPLRPARNTALLALALGMQLLAGDLQIAALNVLVVAAYGSYRLLALRRGRYSLAHLVTALLIGVALAGAQLLPTYELAQHAVRSAEPAPGPLAGFDHSLTPQELAAQPRSLPLLQSQLGVYRVCAQQKAAPSPSVLRESYYPNTPLLYGFSTANGLVSWVPARYAQYIEQMTPQMLNLLGIKYYLILQSLPIDGTSEAHDLDDPFLYNPLDDVMPTPLVMATAVEIEWYLSESTEWRNGTPVALLTFLTEESVDLTTVELTTASHVADWAYDRSDVRGSVRHNQATIARAFPARSGSPPEDHPGYVYRAVVQAPYPMLIHGLRLDSVVPPAHIHIERLTLVDQQGQRYLLSHLEGKSDHTLVYRSEDVAIFQNHDVLPRVFMAYQARAVPDDAQALSILGSADSSPRREVLLAAAQVAPTEPPTAGTERVELSVYDSRQVVVNVQAPAAGYLVLTDAWYPGWRVRVDDQEEPLLRADLIFRAVYLQAGEHTVEFSYEPESFRTGLMISAAALLLVIAVGLSGGLLFS